MRQPVTFAASSALVLALAACQERAPAPPAAPAASAAALATPALQQRIGLLGGMQPGDVLTVADCTLVPLAPGDPPNLCVIPITATAPASGDQCSVNVGAAVSLPKETAHLRWTVAGDATHDFRFRANADPAGFGVRLIDNDLVYQQASPASAPASAALSGSQPIWARDIDQPQQVQMRRVPREWPPRISAYDIYLEYQAKGARDWTACKTWDPVIVNRD